MLLEHYAPPDQGRPILAGHFLPGRVVVAVPEMMPITKTEAPLMLLRTFTNAPTPLGYMLDRGVHIEVAEQQAWQATAVQPDGIETVAVDFPDPGSLTDQGPDLYRSTASASPPDLSCAVCQ